MNAFARIIDGLAKAMAIISALATVTLMAALTSEVATRFAAGRSLPGMVELSETCLVVIVFFGFAYVALQKSHIRMTLATNFASGGLVRAARLTATLLSIAFLVWLAYATGGRAIASFQTGDFDPERPQGPAGCNGLSGRRDGRSPLASASPWWRR